MKKQLHVKSSTGCVHLVRNAYTILDGEATEYFTLCNHRNYFSAEPNSTYGWESTTEKVTCKRCLKAKHRKLEQQASLKEFDKLFLDRCELTKNSTFKEIKHKLMWSIYGQPSKCSSTYMKLIDCSTEHLSKILRMQKQMPNVTRLVINSILNDRKEKKCD